MKKGSVVLFFIFTWCWSIYSMDYLKFLGFGPEENPTHEEIDKKREHLLKLLEQNIIMSSEGVVILTANEAGQFNREKYENQIKEATWALNHNPRLPTTKDVYNYFSLQSVRNREMSCVCELEIVSNN